MKSFDEIKNMINEAVGKLVTKDMGKIRWTEAQEKLKGDKIWRLPTLEEYKLISKKGFEIDTPFVDSYHWTSTEFDHRLAYTFNPNKGKDAKTQMADTRTARAFKSVDLDKLK